jgi:hypothetical protein
MDKFPIPAYWFGPQNLRNWIWENRLGLTQETLEAFREILISDHIVGAQFGQADIHTVIQQTMLNTTYQEIINEMDLIDFRRFVDDVISNHWTDTERMWVPPNPRRLKRTLKDYFDSANLKPRVCIEGVGREIMQAAIQASSHFELAGQSGGVRTPKASIELRNGCQRVSEQMEYFLKLLLEFSLALLEIATSQREDLPIQLQSKKDKKNIMWGNIELALHNASVELLNWAKTKQSPSELLHLKNNIEKFARLCYGTPIERKKRKSVSLGQESFISKIQELPKTDPTNPDEQTRSLPLQEVRTSEPATGAIMELCTQLRQRHRNVLAHAVDSIGRDLPLPEDFYVSAQAVNILAKKLISVLNENSDSLPEAVRIIQIAYDVHYVELQVVAVPGQREYNLVYTNETLMHILANSALQCLAYSKGDQDFWLFPAPLEHTSPLLNPLLIPRKSKDEYRLDFELEVKSVSVNTELPPEFEEEPFLEEQL